MITTGNYKSDILSDTKKLLGISDNSADELLGFIIEDTVNLVLSYCRLTILPYQLYGLIPQIAASVYRTQKSGGVSSITEGDRRIEYGAEAYYARLVPFKAKLPSEISGSGLY